MEMPGQEKSSLNGKKSKFIIIHLKKKFLNFEWTYYN